MEMRVHILAIVAIGAASLAGLAEGQSAAGPPAVTTDRLAATIDTFVPKEFRGSFTMRSSSVVSKPSGKGREERTEVQRVTVGPDGKHELAIISATENGKDVTEQRRQEAEEQRRKGAAPESGDGKGEAGREPAEKSGGDSGVRLPAGKALAIYAFSAPVEAEGLLVASFEPRPQHRKEEEVLKGKLAWSQDTLDPAWIEFSFADPPTGLAEMTMRFELARVGDSLYVRRMVTDGLGGLLFIKRRFHAEMEVTEMQPQPPAP
jgi:hypothetical protein